MKPIKKITATIRGVKDLTPTAREITLELSTDLDFVAGSFVNLFIKIADKVERRAFSISSSDLESGTIDISVRLNPQGKVSPIFWNEDIIGKTVEVMGPLGINTADKMLSKKIFLFGFGIGNGVVKSLASHFSHNNKTESLTIITGNRSAAEIVHLDYFTKLEQDPKIRVEHIVSKETLGDSYKTGYIQEHLAGLDFTGSDVYVCGQEIACQELVNKITETNPLSCRFFIEGFH